MIETPEKEGLEPIPSDLVAAPWQKSYFELHRRITKKMPVAIPSFGSDERTREADVVEGFEDILAEPLGGGLFFNTDNSIYQLTFALSVSSHPAVQEVLRDTNLGPKEIIKILRQERVLSGIKLIDLGCGVPNFARVAHALGAQVYTADDTDLSPETKSELDGHVVIDLNRDNAIAILKRQTGGNFDIVTENIVGTVPRFDDKVQQPEEETILRIGSALLKKGGYLQYAAQRGGFYLKQKI